MKYLSRPVSILLALLMILSVFTMIPFTASAAAPSGNSTVTAAGKSQQVHVGDTYRYILYLDCSKTTDDGKMSHVQGEIHYDKSVLEIQNFDGDDPTAMCPNLGTDMLLNSNNNGGIYFNDSHLNNRLNFSSEKVLVSCTFKVIGEGTTAITGKVTDLGYFEQGNHGTLTYVVENSAIKGEYGERETFELEDCPHDKPVPYVDASGVDQEPITEFTTVKSDTYTLDDGWCVVDETVTIHGRMACFGNVNLILCNGATLTALKGIRVSDNASLTIWQQKKEEGVETGKLLINNVEQYCAGIGSQPNSISGSITINGGDITAKGGSNAAGIGSGGTGTGSSAKESRCGNITINGGAVTATGGSNAAGIGSGIGTGTAASSCGVITINGGVIKATGGVNASGIGNGKNNCSCGAITINGGDVTAKAGERGYGINNRNGGNEINLKWTESSKKSMSVYADSYDGTVNLLSDFEDGDGNLFAAAENVDKNSLAEKTLTPSRPKIPYVDADGVDQEPITEFTTVNSDTISMTAGWYAVEKDVEINERMSCEGNVNLILCNGATLTAHKGIKIADSDNSLTIWQQKKKEGVETGKLLIDNVNYNYAGIGNDYHTSGGTLTINGGDITSNGGAYAAGIGGAGYSFGPLTEITINNGTVNATGGDGGAGIGSGYYENIGRSIININGGVINAKGGGKGAGIGNGYDSTGAEIKLKWTESSKKSMSVTADSYSGAVNLRENFRDSDGNVFAAAENVNVDPMKGKTLTPFSGAVVNLYDIYGNPTETKGFNLYDTFTVYTTLDCSKINGGYIGSLSGQQTYTDSVLALNDELNANGTIKKLSEVFPIAGEQSIGNAATSGVIYCVASNPEIGSDGAFRFNSPDSVLMATKYTVVAEGNASVMSTIKTLASADDDLTRIINKGQVIDDRFTENLTFAKPVSKHTVTWKNGDETLETDEDVVSGSTPEYGGATPEKEEDEEATYTFSGWTDGKNSYGVSDPLPAVEDDVTYTATFSANQKSFGKLELTAGENGSVTLSSGTYGKTADPATLVEVTQEFSISGLLAIAWNHGIKIIDDVSGEIKSGGKMSFYPRSSDTGVINAVPAENYNFEGWFNGDTLYSSDATLSYGALSEDLSLTAKFTKKKYTIVWKNGNETLETDENVPHGETPAFNGETPKKDSTDQYSYTFSGWTDGTNSYAADAIPAATASVTYTATFTQTLRSYKIKFINYDDSPLAEYTVNYGDTPEYKGTTPTKPEDDYTWTFDDWDSEITSVIGEKTYKAKFKTYTTDINPTVTLSGWTYGETANTPQVSGNTGNGLVTFSYKTESDLAFTPGLPTDAGSYILKADIVATNKFNAGSATCEFTIAKAPISPTVTLSGWTYGETAKTPQVSGNTGNGQESFTYALKGSSSFSSTVPTDADTYVVKATIAETKNYLGGEATNEFTIAKAPITPTVTLTGWTYGETANTPQVSGNSGSGQESFTYAIKGSSSFSGTVPTDADTYVVKATIAETKNYLGGEATNEFTIAKAQITLTVTLTGWTYGETAKTPQVSGNSGSGQETFTYAIKGSSSFSATVPTDADTYTVKATIAETKNYLGGEATKEFTIAKAPISPTVTLTGWTYGETANTPQVSGNTGNGQESFTYTIKGSSSFSESVPTDADTYVVKATIAETKNYLGSTATNEFTIAKADFTPAVTVSDWTYGEKANDPVVTDNTSGGKESFCYQRTDIDGAPITTEAPTHAGDYILTAKIEATANYNPAEAQTTFTIKKALLTVTAKNQSINYGSSIAQDQYTVKGLVNGDPITVKLAQSLIKNTITPAVTATDNYTVKKVIGTLSTVNTPFAWAIPSGSAISVKWCSYENVDGFFVYAAYRGEKSYELVSTINDATKTSFDLKKLHKKALDTKKNVLIQVYAFRVLNGKKVKIVKSPTLYVAGLNSKNTNAKKVENQVKTLTMKAGKTFKLKTTVTLADKTKTELGYADKLRYAVSHSNICIAADGTIKAISKGVCNVYVFTQNGARAKIQVTVK